MIDSAEAGNVALLTYLVLVSLFIEEVLKSPAYNWNALIPVYHFGSLIDSIESYNNNFT